MIEMKTCVYFFKVRVTDLVDHHNGPEIITSRHLETITEVHQ